MRNFWVDSRVMPMINNFLNCPFLMLYYSLNDAGVNGISWLTFDIFKCPMIVMSAFTAEQTLVSVPIFKVLRSGFSALPIKDSGVLAKMVIN